MRIAIAAALLAAASSATAQAPPTEAPPPMAAPAVASPWRALSPANTLLIETTKGRIIIEMRPDLAPLTVARIRTLSRQGYYNGALFYRVIEGFMAQTGDKGAKTYRSTLSNLKGEMTFALTPTMPYLSVGSSPAGDVGYIGSVPVTIAAGPAAAGVSAGAAPTSGRGNIVFCPGIVAMAHPANQPDGGNSQFFLMRQYAPSLEKDFAAWGRVVVGQDVVFAIKNGEPPVGPDKMNRVRVLADIPAAERPVVEVTNYDAAKLAAATQAAAQAKGTAFTLCDIPFQTRVNGIVAGA
jgi:peptidylprolyl isomerase